MMTTDERNIFEHLKKCSSLEELHEIQTTYYKEIQLSQVLCEAYNERFDMLVGYDCTFGGYYDY